MEITCTDCGTVFVRMQPRGKPSVRCPDCQKEFTRQRAAEYQRHLKARLKVHRPPNACVDCGATFPRTSGAQAKRCTVCRATYDAEHRLAHRREVRKANGPAHMRSRKNREHLMKTYGLTPEDVDRMLAEQGGCAICGTQESAAVKGWHVDHNHSTGKVRGILCHHCNIGIGLLGDDPIKLRQALAYLEQAA